MLFIFKVLCKMLAQILYSNTDTPLVTVNARVLRADQFRASSQWFFFNPPVKRSKRRLGTLRANAK